MITNYHRPSTFEKVDEYLNRPGIDTRLIAGGYYLNRDIPKEDIEVVDIQSLGMDQVEIKGKEAWIGANVRLNQMLEASSLPESLYKVLKLEANLNLRNQITLPGLLKSAGGRSGLLTWLVGADCKMFYADQSEMTIGEFLAGRKNSKKLITSVILPIEASTSYHQVARTPADLPVICVQVTRWGSGRMRASIGGFGKYPRLAYDGNGTEGIIEAVRNTCYDSTDEWASAEYRVVAAETLVRRCIQEVEA